MWDWLGNAASSGLGQAVIGAGVGYGIDKATGGDGGVGAALGGLGGLGNAYSGGGSLFSGEGFNFDTSSLGEGLGYLGVGNSGGSASKLPSLGVDTGGYSSLQSPSALGRISDFASQNKDTIGLVQDVAGIYSGYKDQSDKQKLAEDQLNMQKQAFNYNLGLDKEREARRKAMDAGATSAFDTSRLGA